MVVNSNHDDDGAGITDLVRYVIKNGSRKYLSSKKKRGRSYSRSRRCRGRRKTSCRYESSDDYLSFDNLSSDNTLYKSKKSSKKRKIIVARGEIV